jgi:HK97 family phage major capsid protein
MDANELLKQLEEAKSKIEAAATIKAKEAAILEVKSLEEKIKALDVKEELKTITTGLDEIKTANVKRDEADKKRDDAIDKLLIGQKDMLQNGGQKGKIITLADAIEASLNEGDNYKNIEMMAMNHKDRNKRFSFEVKGIDQKAVGDIVTGNVTGGSRYGAQFAPNIIENPRRKVHVRSLVPVGNAGPGNTYTFMAENGDGEGAIAPTAESSQKPQLDFDLIEKTVNFEWIAGWVRVSRKAMNNIPGFLSFLNSRLPEKLLRVEDTQLLKGDGNTPNISGIMDSGNFTAATSGASVLAEQLIDSIAQLEDDEERDATGILLRPVEYYGFFKNKASGSGEYDLPQNFIFNNGVLYISGVPVFASTALDDGKFIVGDWRQGAQLLIQEGMRIEFFEQDGDNVKNNKITVRIEESVAFPIYGDNYFIVGDVAGS